MITYAQARQEVREAAPMTRLTAPDEPHATWASPAKLTAPSEPNGQPVKSVSGKDVWLATLKAAERDAGNFVRDFEARYRSLGDVCADFRAGHDKLRARLKRLEEPEPEPAGIVSFSS
jgi:hypothetical protein